MVSFSISQKFRGVSLIIAIEQRGEYVMIQWDATSLITCAKFKVEGRLVLDYALDMEQIIITKEVKEETVDAGLSGGYPDAMEIQARIDSGYIEVRETTQMSDSLEDVLELYGLEDGDKAVVRLSLQDSNVEATITDDRLLFVVLARCGQKAMFTPDFVEQAVAKDAFDAITGTKLLQAIRTRLPQGFVEHSLRRLKGVI
jgi:hypothetical protein